MAKLKVKVDDAPLHSGHAIRGMGFYTRNLITALKDNHEIELNENDFDIIHYPYFDLFANTLRLLKDKKVVVTVPDVIPLLYPNHYPSGVRGKLNLSRQKKALKNVDAVITISETSKKDIIRLLDVPENKIFVTLLGPGNLFKKVTKKVKLPKEFVLYVGDINWNKNLVNFVKALNKANLNGVIVGKNAKDLLDNPQNYNFSHPQLAHLEELHELLKKSKNIYVMGYLEEDGIASVFHQATLYCQPSYYEGSGLPILEAMHAELPIVSARTQALVEVADSSAFYFDPYSIDDITEKLSLVMNSKSIQKELVKLGNVRKNLFSWDKTAKDTLKVYKNV